MSPIEFPDFLAAHLTPAAYSRWLHRKASAHVKRDRARGHSCGVSQYKAAIHQAVLASRGKDAYTGEQLHWHLVSTYDNEESKLGKHKYKATFALLPTVDHVLSDATSASFRICGWRTNDAKHDLAIEDFIALCRSTLVHAGYTVVPPGLSAAGE